MVSMDVGDALSCVLGSLLFIPTCAVNIIAIFVILVFRREIDAVGDYLIDDEFLRAVFFLGFSFFGVAPGVVIRVFVGRDVFQQVCDELFVVSGFFLVLRYVGGVIQATSVSFLVF